VKFKFFENGEFVDKEPREMPLGDTPISIHVKNELLIFNPHDISEVSTIISYYMDPKVNYKTRNFKKVNKIEITKKFYENEFYHEINSDGKVEDFSYFYLYGENCYASDGSPWFYFSNSEIEMKCGCHKSIHELLDLKNMEEVLEI
jgi:hypothetical protein